MTFCVLIYLLLAGASGQAATIKGVVLDESSRKPLPNANVWLASSGRGTATNARGEFQLSDIWRADTLCISHIGFEKKRIPFVTILSEEYVLTIQLMPRALDAPSVKIEAYREREEQEMIEMEPGAAVLDVEEVFRKPFVAEPDLIRALQVMPSVVSQNELAAQIHIRGGSSDHDLLLLDGIPLTQSHHLWGIFSAVSANMVDRVSFSPGGFSCRYGNHLGSVTQLKSRFNWGERTGESMTSVISSNIFFETDIGKAHWNFSARRTYLDAFLKLFDKNQPYYFYDIYSKLGFQINENILVQGGYSHAVDMMYNHYTNDSVYGMAGADSSFIYAKEFDWRFPWSTTGGWLKLEWMPSPEWLVIGSVAFSRAGNEGSKKIDIRYTGGNFEQYEKHIDEINRWSNKPYDIDNQYTDNLASFELAWDAWPDVSLRLGGEWH